MSIQIREQNCTTGEVIDRDMTVDELTAREENKKDFDERKKQQDKAAIDKASATAKLEALGLTADDLKALGL